MLGKFLLLQEAALKELRLLYGKGPRCYVSFRLFHLDVARAQVTFARINIRIQFLRDKRATYAVLIFPLQYGYLHEVGENLSLNNRSIIWQSNFLQMVN